MKQHLSILAGGLLALGLPLRAQSQPAPAAIVAPADFGASSKESVITEVKIKNMQGESLGRIGDLTLDLSNNRVVEILVASDQTFRRGGKIAAVPPSALIPDAKNKIYQINISLEDFKDAPIFILNKWAEYTTPEQIAEAYRYFKQEPYFIVPSEAGKPTNSVKAVYTLGVVERMSKLINMNVANLQGQRLGRLESLVLDVPNGRILSAFITEGNVGEERRYSSIVQASQLTYDAKRTGLLIDLSRAAYDQLPHAIFENGAGGQIISYREQPSTAPNTSMELGLTQGTSVYDVATTARIKKSILSGNLDAKNVQISTLDGRVTLRGPVSSDAVKNSLVAIAIAAASLDNLDNEITVVAHPSAKL